MNKEDLLLELAYSNVPKGAIKISEQIGDNIRITKLDPGARAIKQAEIFHRVLVQGLSDLPEEVTPEHHGQIVEIVRGFFNSFGEMEVPPVSGGMLEMLAKHRDGFLAKLGELLPQTGI